MTTALDMSLDDIIKTNKKFNSRGARPPRSSSGPGTAPARCFSNLAVSRTAPHSNPAQALDTTWQHDMFMETAAAPAAFAGRAGRASSLRTGTKLCISNLDYGVSTEDIKVFSEVGEIKRYAVHYDRSGRSEGTAVVFARREDVFTDVKRYDNVQLDGKPMKIEIVGTNIVAQTAAAAPPPANSVFRNQNGARRSQGRSGTLGRPRGGGHGARRGCGRGRGRGEKVSAEDLDADLEKYHSDAMQEK